MHIYDAKSFVSRFFGLMGRRLENGRIRMGHARYDALLLRNTNQIHTHFMRFDIDVYYLDSNGIVIKSQRMRPWRVGPRVKDAKHIIECPASAQCPISTNESIWSLV